MIAALLFSLLVTYRKPRKYEDKPLSFAIEPTTECSKYTIMVVALAAILTFTVQLLTHSLPLGALVGLGVIFSFKVIPQNKMDHMMNEGIYLMGYVAFVMLVAAGFASVLKSLRSNRKPC